MKIQNDFLIVDVTKKGAQLTSIKNKKTGYEYLWQADPEIWPRHAPILFPILGALQDDEFIYNDQIYNLGKHGFLRDQQLDCSYYSKNKIAYQFIHYGNMKTGYPFACTVTTTFELKENTLINTYTITNNDTREMYYSIGGHPGFNITPPTTIKLEGNSLKRYIFEGEFIGDVTETNEKEIHIRENMFHNDALVYEGVNSVTLQTKPSITVDVSEFPYVGIWSKHIEDAYPQYVCIEPWGGLPDTTVHEKLLKHKKGIQALSPKESKDFTFVITFEL